MKLKAIAMGIAIASSSLLMPTAQAGTTASIGVASAYIFRGVIDSTPQVYGALDHTAKGGFHANVWTSSSSTSSETDITLGWGFSINSVSFDFAVIDYLYPEKGANTASDALDDNDTKEFNINVGVGSLTGSMFQAFDTSPAAGSKDNKYTYFSLSGSMDKYSFTMGAMFNDDKVEKDTDYFHLDLGYAATENISFAISQIISGQDKFTGSTNPNFRVSYDLQFDI